MVKCFPFIEAQEISGRPLSVSLAARGEAPNWLLYRKVLHANSEDMSTSTLTVLLHPNHPF